MKIILAIAMCLSLTVSAKTQVSASQDMKKETVLGMVDFSSIFQNVRGNISIDSKGEMFYGGHIPIISIIGKTSKAEYINLNFGGAYSSDKKKSDFMLSIGIRLDTYISRLDRYPNIRTAAMPAVEVGPFISYGFNKWMWGGMIAVGFGK